MKLFLCLSLLTLNAYALNFDQIFTQVKEKVSAVLGEKSPTKKTTDVIMPRLPEVKKDATSISVFEKKGRIFQQGEAFKNLSTHEKRKYRIAFIQELYFSVFEDDISASKTKTFLNNLEQQGSREGIYRSLVLGDEYAALEGYNSTPNDKLVNYVIKFGKKFLHKTFNQDLLRKLNLYGIKRILVEKQLELIEAFPVDGKDLYRWYALLSVDLAREFPSLWSGKIRPSTSAKTHMKWAQSVPFQHIKSELIIKMHKALNSIK